MLMLQVTANRPVVHFFSLLSNSFVFNACNCIIPSNQNGVELLIMVLPMVFAGGIVLPLLGAVPDSAIIIVSGLGDDAQEKLSVGMG